MELMRNRDHMLDTWVEFGNKELQIGALHVKCHWHAQCVLCMYIGSAIVHCAGHSGSARSYVPLVSGRSLANKMGCRTSGDLH